MLPKKCPSCNSEFETKNIRKVYCSRKCKTAAWNKKAVGTSYFNNAQYRYKYGISYDDKVVMNEQQHGCCAICGGHEEEVGVLHVDHDHETGQVRKLLCHNCNVVLGLMKDNPERLIAAASYLMEYQNVLGEVI